MASQYHTPNTADVEHGTNGQLNERQPLLGRANGNGHVLTHQDRSTAVKRCWCIGGYAILLALLGLIVVGLVDLFTGHRGGLGAPNHKHLHRICDKVEPISTYEFEERQTNLSKVLLEYKAVAYIAEPGPNLLHLTNIHWGLSERPFLLVIQAKKDEMDQLLTKVTLVAPAFEATRARQKVLPGSSLEIKTWEEAESAYSLVNEVLNAPWAGPDDDVDHQLKEDFENDLLNEKEEKTNKPLKKRTRYVFLDPDMRHFVAQGLSNKITTDTTKVSMAPKAISLLRERKTAHEIEILRCVAQATVRVIQTVKSEIKVGMRESEVQSLMTRAYASSGLDYEHGGSLVLFGTDAALPHGSGNDTKLKKGMMVLIDTGAHLHGYVSDITRTFWVARGSDRKHNDELDKVWHVVKLAQEAALNATRPGVSPASVDKAARKVIDGEGYGKYFTHRLGHGIGLEGHEEPYLNGGNTDSVLKTGMTFTDEPGVYVEGSFGIRLEDMVLVTESGYELLSGKLAESPDKP